MIVFKSDKRGQKPILKKIRHKKFTTGSIWRSKTLNYSLDIPEMIYL